MNGCELVIENASPIFFTMRRDTHSPVSKDPLFSFMYGSSVCCAARFRCAGAAHIKNITVSQNNDGGLGWH